MSQKEFNAALEQAKGAIDEMIDSIENPAPDSVLAVFEMAEEAQACIMRSLRLLIATPDYNKLPR